MIYEVGMEEGNKNRVNKEGAKDLVRGCILQELQL